MNRAHFDYLLDLADDYLDKADITDPPYSVNLTDYGGGPHDRIHLQWLLDPGIPGKEAATVNSENPRLRSRTVAYGLADLVLTWEQS